MRHAFRAAMVLAFAIAGLFAPAVAQSAGRPGTEEAAIAVFRILQRQDWVGLYSVTAFSETVTDALPADPEDFAADVRHGIVESGNKELVDRMFAGMSDMAVGAADVKGDYATLPTSCAITLQGKRLPFRGSMHLIRRQHAWKWDLTFTDKAADATAKALAELIGQPEDSSGAPAQ